MGKKFEYAFSEPLDFTDENYQISRNQYDKDQAALEFSSHLGEVIDPKELKENWVRYQFAPEELRWEMDCTHCWMVVPEGTKNAQPTWSYQ